MNKIINSIVALLFCQYMIAQTYELTVLNEAYVPLQEAISVNNGEIWDDPEELLPIGFEALFFASTISELNLGIVGSALYTGDEYGPEPLNLIFPFQADVIDRGYVEEISQSDILYSTSGEVGERIFIIEWNNAGFYEELFADEPGNNDFVNFQFQIFESTGVIRFHYGASSVVQPELVYEGENGPLVGLILGLDYYSYESQATLILSGDPASPVVLTNADYYDNVTLDSTPTDGTVYQFSPIATSLNDYETTTFSLYPNPATDVLQIKTDGQGTFDYVLFDIKGMNISHGSSGDGHVDIASLLPGSYFIEIQEVHSIARRMFIKTGR